MPNIMHKTKARGVRYDGHYFPSEAECERYKTLKQREQDGTITDLELQPRYRIAHPDNGLLICTYVGDFRYRNATCNLVVEDVKGLISDVYKIKRKMMRAFYGIRIAEVVPRPVTRNKQIVRYRWFVNGVEESE